MIYKCPRCGYNTTVNTNYKRHISNKIICNPLISDISIDDIQNEFSNRKINNKYECNGCSKKYSSKDSLRNHKKICESFKINNPVNNIITNNVTNNNIINNNIQNQVIIQINTDNPKLNIQEFLHENIEHITDEFIMKCAMKLDNGLIDFIKTIRFNPNHPENMNVKIHVKRDKTLYVYKDKRWEICDGNWTLEEMILHGAKIINQKFLTHADREKITDEDSSESRVHTWLLSILPRDNARLLGKLSKRLYAMILDNQRLILLEQHDEDSQIVTI
jgi:hypothetical protein